MSSLTQVRLLKVLYSLSHFACWRGLYLGVAPAIEHLPVLRKLSIDGIIDVGANRGQFSLTCILCHPAVPIVAFEPIPGEAAIYRRLFADRKGVDLIQSAVGDTNCEATLNISAKADSSSLLPIGENQIQIFPGTEAIGTINVQIQRLDEHSHSWRNRNNQLLKLDVQGYELSVLRGAVNTLRRCAHVYAECSEIPLYNGQALREEVVSFLREHGFTVRGRYNPSYKAEQLIQADYLFSRDH